MSQLRLRPYLLLALLSVTPAVHPIQAQTMAREVWSRAELEAAGVQRFADVVQLLGRWTVSVDGHGWIISPDALPTAALPRAGLPEWVLIVDGHRIDVSGAGGIWFTELVPVLVHQIDSVEVVRTPTLAGGGLTTRGVLRVHTRRAPAGASAMASIRMGSETGDPGPYAFTTYATPNVDRVGVDRVVLAGYGGRRWGVELSGRDITNSMTDPELDTRFGTDTLHTYTSIRVPALLAHADALGGRHSLTLSRPVQDGFAFLPSRGRLERASIALAQAGVTGSLSTGGGAEATYRLSHAKHRYQPLPDNFPGDTSHTRTFSHGSLGLRWRRAIWSGEAGLGVEHRTLDMPGMPDQRRVHGTLFAAAERRVSSAWEQQATGAIVLGGGRIAFRANAGARWSPDSASSLVGSLALVQQLAEEGSGWIDARLLHPSSPARLSDRTFARGEVAWRGPMLPGIVKIEIGASMVAVTAHGAERTAANGGAEGLGGSDGELQGGRVGARVSLESTGSPRLRGRLSYHAIAPLASSESWAAADATLSRHVAIGTLAYTPIPTLRVGAVLDIRSTADWRRVDPALLNGETGAALDGRVRLDVIVDKWAWQRRLRVQLMVRNLADAPERYHPIGARFDQRFYFSGSVELPPRIDPPIAAGLRGSDGGP